MLYLKIILTSVFWGSAFIAARLAAPHAGPGTLSFLRYAVATALLFVLLKRRETLAMPPRHERIAVFWLGFVGIFLYNLFFFWGMQTVPASRASLIVNTNPVFITFFAAILFKERLRGHRLAGVLLAAFGAAVLISRGDPQALVGSGLDRGDLLMIICLACWVIYALISKVTLSDMSPLASAAWSCLVGAVLLLPAALYEGFLIEVWHLPLVVWLATLWLAVFGTVLGVLWYFEAINGLGVGRASVFITLSPVTSVALGVLFLGETVSISLLLGGFLAIIGVWLANQHDTVKTRS